MFIYYLNNLATVFFVNVTDNTFSVDVPIAIWGQRRAQFKQKQQKTP